LPSVPPLGVYTGPGAAAAAEEVDQHLGDRIRYAFDFLPDSTWTTLTDPSWLLRAWTGSPFDLVIGVPMLPVSDATLSDGAAGEYDQEFDLLAQRLVAGGLGGAVLLIGWQPDDTGNPWYVTTAAAARDYVDFWDHIQSTMAAVAGAHFVFEWDAGDADASPVSPAQMYPGNAAVDLVATDAFDTAPADRAATGQWSVVLNEPFGPAWMASFAAAHGKPMALAMWVPGPASAGGGVDAPAFAADLLQWAATARLRMCVLWDYGDWAVTGGGFPATAARLRQMLAQLATTSAREEGVRRPRDAPQTGVGRDVRTLRIGATGK
jgi:hypothetical protein